MNFKATSFYSRRQLFDRKTKLFLDNLSASQSLSKDELWSLNWNRLKLLVDFVYQEIPFYRRKLSDVGFKPGDLKSRQDFARLPILDKEEIRSFTSQIINRQYDVNKLPKATTGGTTGEPLKTYSDPNYPLQVISWRTLGWWNVHPYDNSGYLLRITPNGLKKYIQKTMLFPTRRAYIAAAEMSEEEMGIFYRELVDIQPKYLVGYVGALEIFAEFVKNNSYNLSSLKAIWTTSSPLPELKRKYMQNIFDSPVYTQYGSCEFYWISCECRMQNGLHVANDIRHVEIVEDDMPVDVGKFGDIIITDLINYAFPLIRYRIGDQGRLLENDCECNLPFPLMDYVRGRISDTIHLPFGKAIPGEYWTTIFDDYSDNIKSFQVFQKKDYSIEVLFEPHGEEYESTINAVKKILESKLMNAVPLKFKKQKINVNENGKTRFVISKVNITS